MSTTSTSQLPERFHDSSGSTAEPILIAQGAEALVYKINFLTSDTPCALKYRPVKSWRHPVLDRRLTRSRLLSEARSLTRCRKDGVHCPTVLAADWEAGWLVLEWIEGFTIRKCLDYYLKDAGASQPRANDSSEAQQEPGLSDLMARVGKAVGRLHEIGVVHGDLTTSNIMLKPHSSQQSAGSPSEYPTDLSGDVVLIDFGLANQLVQDEDRAVDLYVLERAFGSTHPAAAPLFQEVLTVYGESYKGAKAVLKRLEEVRMRGRKRSMVG